MAESWDRWLRRWADGGLIDDETAVRIREFELARAGSSRLRWPIWIALTFGALMLGAGVLLFVSAHWDSLSPRERFALVLLLVAVFHVAGAMAADRVPAMASAFHLVGTVSLGAGIFLAGQIFNLDEHWPGGLMLWTLGAAVSWGLLRDAPQMALVAILAPAWLTAEWAVATERITSNGARPVLCGLLLLALTYLTSDPVESCAPAAEGEAPATARRVLVWLGGIGLLPLAAALALEMAEKGHVTGAALLPTGLRILGWSVAFGLPLALAIALRGPAAWANLLSVCWVGVLVKLRPVAGPVSMYAWWALGATALVAWGVREARSERVNLGSAIFAATILTFYFSEVMDKLGRSASLAGFGLLFLAGGWALERLRRQLVLRARGGEA